MPLRSAGGFITENASFRPVGQPGNEPVAAPAAAVRSVAAASLIAGAWALVPPYWGPALSTEASVEFVDHVLPGIAVLAIAAACLLAGTRRVGATLAFLLAGLGVTLAGFWMTATHWPLVLQATRGEVPWGSTVHHSLPGLAVLAVGGFWSARFWGDD